MATLTPSILTTAAQCFTRQDNIWVEPGNPMTDGQVIYLPGMKAGLTPAEMTVLRGYFDHESAHIIYKSFNAMDRARNDHDRTMFNAVEDARIEAHLNAEYPGTIGTIASISSHGLAVRNANPGDMSAFDQAAHAVLWRLKGVDRSRVTYCPAGWAILDMIDTSDLDAFDPVTASPRDAMTLAQSLVDRVLAAIDSARQDDTPEPKPGDDGDSGESGGNGGGEPDGQPGDDGDADGSGNASRPDADSADSGQSGDTDGADGGDSDSDSAGAGAGSGDWSTETEKHSGNTSRSTYADAIEGMTDQTQTARSDYRVASAVATASRPMQRVSASPMAGLYTEIHSAAMRIATSLRRHLEANDRVHWSLPRESGHRIDRRTLPTVASGLGISAFNRRRVDRAHKTQVTILLDCSGSMRPMKDTATRAAFIVADACETIGCPTGIIGFDTGLFDIKRPGRVTPGTRMRPLDCGGTSLLPALLRERMESAARPTHRRVVFIVTDGEASDREGSVQFIQQERAAGVDYHGIGIYRGTQVHDACNTATVCQPSDLVERMETVLRSYRP